YQDYLPNYSRFYTTNVVSTALIYELIEREKLGIEKVIVASSQAALGEGLYLDADEKRVLPGLRSNEQLAKGLWEIQPRKGERGPLKWTKTDETVANPQNPYGMSKIAEEQAALNLGRRCGVPSVAMRYSIVQGPRQSFYNSYSGACRLFCLSFHLGREPMIYEDGQQVRDFVNIDDVVDANVRVLEDSRADYEMFNVGGGEAVTVVQFAETVARVFGVESYRAVPCAKYRFGDTRHIFSDISKLKALGWSPKRTVVDSVTAYRDWLRNEEATQDILDYGNAQMAKLGVVRDVAK
ncbi:MAG TPA: NAD-dependent epimerase/dehydratase family protein, partial [Polyangiaceae bacterium]|nr:NAD-dependent epimerase/dehydratase family protein [Polyangiaceae bacterium]